MINHKRLTLTNVLSFVLAFLASSHHWLHMGVLALLGGSATMMETMSTVIWLRRAMIVMTLATVVITLFRLYRHRCKDARMIAMSALSTALSLGFILYTLNGFGW